MLLKNIFVEILCIFELNTIKLKRETWEIVNVCECLTLVPTARTSGTICINIQTHIWIFKCSQQAQMLCGAMLLLILKTINISVWTETSYCVDVNSISFRRSLGNLSIYPSNRTYEVAIVKRRTVPLRPGAILFFIGQSLQQT